MFVSIYYTPSLFNAHTMILIVHIFMNVNKLCLKNKTKTKLTIKQYLLYKKYIYSLHVVVFDAHGSTA